MSTSNRVPASISNGGLGEGTVREGLQTLKEHGFTHIHFGLGWREQAPLGREIIEKWQADLAATGMRVLDVHGPHTREHNLWSEDRAARDAAIAMVTARLQLTKALGGDAMVYHVPTGCQVTPTVVNHLIDSFRRLEPVATGLGINIALENHYDLENDRAALSACFQQFSPEYIGFTFDSGHALRSGNTDWLIEYCFDRLTVLHLTNNEEGQDRHWIPSISDGYVDWELIAKSIAKSPYEKPIQLEVRRDEKYHADHRSFLKDAYEDAIKISEDVAKYRREMSP